MAQMNSNLHADGATDAELVLEAHGVVVAYDSYTAVRSVDLRVQRGETIVLLGPSGSGKTTLLYAIAGFLPLTAGEIRMQGRLVSSGDRTDPPERRPVAMVFQHYGLWPHLDARDTVAYPLERAGVAKGPARVEAESLLSDMRIGHLAARHPAELSGGEQQRVGLARALAKHPALYLLDEPTAHLDTVLRSDLRAELTERMRAGGSAVVHATHDVEEALSVAHRVLLLREGAVVQIDRPEDIYARPVDAWAARLTGPASFVPASMVPPSALPRAASGSAGAVDLNGSVMVRPDWVRFEGPLRATVRERHFRGTHTDYRLGCAEGELLLRQAGPPHLEVGAQTSCRIERGWPLAGSAKGDAGPYPVDDARND